SVLVGRLESELLTQERGSLPSPPLLPDSPGGMTQSDQGETGQKGEAAAGDPARSLHHRGDRQFLSRPAGETRRQPAQPASDQRYPFEVQSFRVVEPPAAQVVFRNAGGVGRQKGRGAQLRGGRGLTIAAPEVQINGRVEDRP